jgi:signal transduction histidine kinase/DNA-binding NarL/FixJ family response regulator
MISNSSDQLDFKEAPKEALSTEGRLFLAFNDQMELAVRGQIIRSDRDDGSICFVGIPWLAWMRERYPNSEPRFDEFPVHDSQMDQLLLLSSQQKMLEDLQMLNDNLEQAKTEVEGQGEVRQQFFNRVSHEVRTPLMGVSSALTLLADKIRDPLTLDLLSMAEASMDRATEVINFALGDAVNQDSRPEQFTVATDLRHLGKSLRKLFLASATEKGLTLEVSISDDVQAQYWCSDLLLKEVLINLLSNAVKFTRQGSIELDVRLTPSSQEALHQVIFQVSDSGPGVPESLRRQVFSPFETGVSIATKGQVGTGLGLSMSESHVKTMGGTIAVGESRTGGALFTVVLPLTPCAGVDKLSHSEQVVTNLTFDKRLLLLDDSVTNLSLNAQLLRSLGFTVATAMSGGEAIEAVKRAPEPFDVALLDINLPDMTGYEVAARLSKLPQCTDTKLLALSAYSQEEEKQKAFVSGMVAFITKPFKRDAIADEFARLFDSEVVELEVGSSVTEAPCPLFEPSYSNEMLDLLGEEVVQSLLTSLSNEGRANMAVLQQTVIDKGFEDGARAAHTLKSSSKALGLLALSDQMSEIEAQLTNGLSLNQDTLDQAAHSLGEGLRLLEAHLAQA